MLWHFIKSTRGYFYTKLFSKYYVNINCADAICSAFGHFVKLLLVRILPSSRSGQPVINLDSSSFFESTIAGSGSSYSIVSSNMLFVSFLVISTSFPSTTSLRSSQINHLRSFLCTLMLEVCPASSDSYQWPESVITLKLLWTKYHYQDEEESKLYNPQLPIVPFKLSTSSQVDCIINLSAVSV